MQLIQRIPFSAFAPSALATRFATLGLVAAVVLSHLIVDGHDGQRLLQVGFFFIFSIAAVLYGRADELPGPFGRKAPGASLAAFLVLGVVSSAFAASSRHAILEVATVLMLLLVAAAVAIELARGGRPALLATLRLLAAGSAVYAVKVLAILLSGLAVGAQVGVMDLTPGFSNYRFLNHAQTISLPLLVLLCALEDPRSRWARLWWSVAAFWWALLFVTSGRGTMLGLLAGGAVAYTVGRQHVRPFARAMLLSALAGAIVYALVFVVLPFVAGVEPPGLLSRVVDRTLDNPTSSRLELWQLAAELTAAHPWIGAGPLHYAHASLRENAAHPHNLVFQVAAEWGLPALACLGLAVTLGFRRLLGARRLIAANDIANHTIHAALLATGVAIVVDSLVSGVLVMPVSQLLVALYLGCAAGWVATLGTAAVEAARPGGGWRNAVGAVLLLAAISGIAFGVGPGIVRIVTGEQVPPAEEAWYPTHLKPRFWNAGHF